LFEWLRKAVQAGRIRQCHVSFQDRRLLSVELSWSARRDRQQMTQAV
jgi:hypothetical protein